jgi:hypothetical protein
MCLNSATACPEHVPKAAELISLACARSTKHAGQSAAAAMFGPTPTMIGSAGTVTPCLSDTHCLALAHP